MHPNPVCRIRNRGSYASWVRIARFLLLLAVMAAAVAPTGPTGPTAEAADVRTAVQRAMTKKDPKDRAMELQRVLEGADGDDAARAVAELVFREDEPQVVLDVGVIALARMQAPDAFGAAAASSRTHLQRALLAEALGRTDVPGSLLPLLEMARSTLPQARTAAINALAERSDAGRVEDLMVALTDPHAPVRSAAMRGLAMCGDRRAVAPLAAAMRRESGRLVDDAAMALSSITGKRFGADPRAWEREAGGTASSGPEWTPPPPAFRSPLFSTRSRRILFVLSVADTMKDPVSAPAPDSDVVVAVAKAGDDLADALRNAKTKMDAARTHLRAMLRTLEDGVRFDVMTYGASPTFAFGELTPADDASRKKAEARIRSLSPGGPGDIHEALLRIFDPRAKAPFENGAGDDAGPDTVVFLSDGTLPATGMRDRTEIAPRAVRWNRVRQIRFLVAAAGQAEMSELGMLAGGPPLGALVGVP
ncbi:MAG: hypothetical protein HMLKMBBP_01730 [Planctomycetes bacterium]|nr:hypothetical protein [Planctomycetota bacterium]